MYCTIICIISCTSVVSSRSPFDEPRERKKKQNPNIKHNVLVYHRLGHFVNVHDRLSKIWKKSVNRWWFLNKECSAVEMVRKPSTDRTFSLRILVAITVISHNNYIVVKLSGENRWILTFCEFALMYLIISYSNSQNYEKRWRRWTCIFLGLDRSSVSEFPAGRHLKVARCYRRLRFELPPRITRRWEYSLRLDSVASCIRTDDKT